MYMYMYILVNMKHPMNKNKANLLTDVATPQGRLLSATYKQIEDNLDPLAIQNATRKVSKE